MAKALGMTPEEEHKTGIHKIAKVGMICFSCTYVELTLVQQLQGQVGLLFTDTEPQEVIEWFDDFKQADFARNGNIASRDVTIPEGPVMRQHSDPPEPFPHNEEPQLRKLGLSTTMVRGVPTLTSPHKLCTKGKPLTSEQAQLLKLIGIRMVIFRVRLKARWDSATGETEQINTAELTPEEGLGEPAGEGNVDEDAMSD